MKQSFFVQRLVGVFSKLNINHPYVLDSFHLDFFLSLYRAIDVPVFVLLPDFLFDDALKYLESLQKDNGVIFVPPIGAMRGGVASSDLQKERECEMWV